MKYNNLKAIIAAKKSTHDMRAPSDSFYIATPRKDPYIEPTFTKEVFGAEQPQVVLISAIGATGKSALAHVLSSQLALPLLDLGKHKPVGDNSMTGLLTGAFAIEQLSAVFGAISKGEFGLIIDGIDEGRSKTTEQGFHAFLEDIARLCENSPVSTVVLLGRTQAVEECWYYFEERKLSTGLVTIDPFNLEQAKKYIDIFTEGHLAGQSVQYRQVRDQILAMLAAAFDEPEAAAPASPFASFIGYPPVLDSIVTLLQREQNYHRLIGELTKADAGNVELSLLHRIASYILERERDEKVLPNIVQPLLKTYGAALGPLTSSIFDDSEQCLRLVSAVAGISTPIRMIEDDAANAAYEEQLAPFFQEHPFLVRGEFRNAIFEAVAIATLVSSDRKEAQSLALMYLDSHRTNQYVVSLLSVIAEGKELPAISLRVLLGSALEFRARGATVEISVVADSDGRPEPSGAIVIDIDITKGAADSGATRFSFKTRIDTKDTVSLGSKIANAYIEMPCNVVLGGESPELELTAPVEVVASTVELRSSSMVIRPCPESSAESQVSIEAGRLTSHVINISSVGGTQLSVATEHSHGITYPLIQYVRQKQALPADPLLREKYLRLRKMLTHFRSHSKGALAKYKDKIEHPKIAGNEVGRAVLRKLQADGVVYLEGALYFLEPARIDEFLGVSWPDLRRGELSPKLLQYLSAISV